MCRRGNRPSLPENRGNRLELVFRHKNRHEAGVETFPEAGFGLRVIIHFLAVLQGCLLQISAIVERDAIPLFEGVMVKLIG